MSLLQNNLLFVILSDQNTVCSFDILNKSIDKYICFMYKCSICHLFSKLLFVFQSSCEEEMKDNDVQTRLSSTDADSDSKRVKIHELSGNGFVPVLVKLKDNMFAFISICR